MGSRWRAGTKAAFGRATTEHGRPVRPRLGDIISVFENAARASRINSRNISSHLEIESDVFPHGPPVLSYSQDRGES